MYVKYHVLHMGWVRTPSPVDNWNCCNTRGAGPCWVRSQIRKDQKLQAGVQVDQKLPISGRKKASTKNCVSAPTRTLLHSKRSRWRTTHSVSLIIKYPIPTLKPTLVSPSGAIAEDRAAHLRQLLLQHSFSHCVHE